MVSQPVGLLRHSLPDIYQIWDIWEIQYLFGGVSLCKSTNATQLSTQLIIHAQLLDYVNGWVHVKFDMPHRPGEGVLKVRLR